MRTLEMFHSIRLTDTEIVIVSRATMKADRIMDANPNRLFADYCDDLLETVLDDAARYFNVANQYAQDHDAVVRGCEGEAVHHVNQMLKRVYLDAMGAGFGLTPMEMIALPAWQVVNMAKAVRDARADE